MGVGVVVRMQYNTALSRECLMLGDSGSILCYKNGGGYQITDKGAVSFQEKMYDARSSPTRNGSFFFFYISLNLCRLLLLDSSTLLVFGLFGEQVWSLNDIYHCKSEPAIEEG